MYNSEKYLTAAQNWWREIVASTATDTSDGTTSSRWVTGISRRIVIIGAQLTVVRTHCTCDTQWHAGTWSKHLLSAQCTTIAALDKTMKSLEAMSMSDGDGYVDVCEKRQIYQKQDTCSNEHGVCPKPLASTCPGHHNKVCVTRMWESKTKHRPMFLVTLVLAYYITAGLQLGEQVFF